MTTSEELWAEGERAWESAVEACVPSYERLVDTSVLFDLALKCHEASLREFERAIAAMQMAVRRAQRAKRHSRRASLTLIKAARSVAAAKHERRATVNDVLKREGFR
jgi:hypothetical protein